MASSLLFSPGSYLVTQQTINSPSSTLQYMNTFFQALDSGKEVCVVFCDISKAFYRVRHKGLLCKLKVADMSGTCLVYHLGSVAISLKGGKE